MTFLDGDLNKLKWPNRYTRNEWDFWVRSLTVCFEV